MELNYQDKGNYFRGLLILIGKDNIIHDRERESILKIGKKLGYEYKFCDQAVDDFLENEHIQLQPPVFSTKEIAIKFLEDAINLSLVDNDFHVDELQWLHKVAEENEIENSWIDRKLKNTLLKIDTNKLNALKEIEVN